jgi:hypothetical protein
MATTLSPIQMQLLRMFSFQKDEKELEEMRDVLLNHIRTKTAREIDKVWKEKGMTNEMMHELKNAHFRTPYNR